MQPTMSRLASPRLAGLALVALAGLAAVPAAGLVATPEAEAAQTLTIDELLAGFAAMPGLYAEFRQESHFGLLAEPLVDTGTLHFADGKLARRTRSPTPSVVIMDGAGIEYGDGETRERIDLAGKPAVRQFVDAFTNIFAGDRAGLEALYKLDFRPRSAGGDSWTLVLTPKVSPMDEIIAKVEVEGAGLAIAELRVVETNGDETITLFSKVDTARKYTKAEQSKLFSVEL